MNYWKSQLPDILLPAIPQESAATLMSIQFQLEWSQWYTPEQIATMQHKQLGLLRAHARAQSHMMRRLCASYIEAL